MVDFIYSRETWALIIGAAVTFTIALYIMLGGEQLFQKKVARHVFRPVRTNIKGRFVFMPSGLEKIDWRKGYNAKYQMLYLEGRKHPVLNVIFPRTEDVIRACPYATVVPESMEATLMGDPRGVILRYIPPRVREVQIFKEGRQITSIPREFQLSKESEINRDLWELERLEELQAAKKTSVERTQEQAHAIGEIGEAFGKVVSPMLSAIDKKRGG